MTVTPARRAALRTLRAVSRGRRLDLAFGEAAAALVPDDRRWVHELVYGVARLRGRLDHLLSLHVRRGLPPEAALDVLRLGAYQLLYMDSVPDYAAVSQTVDQAREAAGAGAASLANAVLRKVAAAGDGPERFPDPERDPVGWLSTWGSHPRWLVERWLARWSRDEVARLVELDNRPPALHLVPLEDAPERALERLLAAGVEARPAGWGSGALEIVGAHAPSRLLETLPSFVQDPGAALVTVYADAPEGALVADLCAAPGGKALALTRRAAYVLAADRSLARLRLVRENLARTGRRAGAVVALAEAPAVARADLVLLDVPCSGTGTLRRHPDARWRLRPEDVATLAATQARMLDAAKGVVGPGGLLVYSTCTLEAEENEAQVERFLARSPDFRREPGAGVDATLLDALGHLVVLPQHTGFDGAFAARLRRAG